MISAYFVGELGGFRSYLGFFAPRAMDAKRGGPRRFQEWRFESLRVRSLEAAMAWYLGNCSSRPKTIVIAIAGAIDGTWGEMPFPAWRFDADTLAETLHRPVTLITDAEAAAEGIAALLPKELITVQAGRADPTGDRVVLHVGTSLRAAVLAPDGAVRPLPSAIGQHELIAQSDLQHLLIETNRLAIAGPVTIDRLVSSQGMGFLYYFMRRHEGHAEAPAVQEALEADPLSAAHILAQHPKDPLASRSLMLHAELLAGVAADVVAATNARGGLYLTGELPTALTRSLKRHLLAPFRAKLGPDRGLDEVPVHLVKTERVGMLGAAQRAKAMNP